MRPYIRVSPETLDNHEIGQLPMEDRGLLLMLFALEARIDDRGEHGLPTGRLDTLDNVAWHLRCGWSKIADGLQRLNNAGFVVERDSCLYLTQEWVIRDTSRDRTTCDYKAWRAAVFERDSYTCVVCGHVGGLLRAHHIKPWAENAKSRFDVANGITLCHDCHTDEHRRMSHAHIS